MEALLDRPEKAQKMAPKPPKAKAKDKGLPAGHVLTLIRGIVKKGSIVLVQAGRDGTGKLLAVEQVRWAPHRRPGSGLDVAMKRADGAGKGCTFVWVPLPSGARVMDASGALLAVVGEGPDTDELIPLVRKPPKPRAKRGGWGVSQLRLVATGTRFVEEDGTPIGYRSITPIPKGSCRLTDRALKNRIQEVLAQGRRVFTLKKAGIGEVVGVSIAKRGGYLQALFLNRPENVPSYEALQAGKAKCGPAPRAKAKPEPFVLIDDPGKLLVSPFSHPL